MPLRPVRGRFAPHGTERSIPRLFDRHSIFLLRENEEKPQGWRTSILAGMDKAFKAYTPAVGFLIAGFPLAAQSRAAQCHA